MAYNTRNDLTPQPAQLLHTQHQAHHQSRYRTGLLSGLMYAAVMLSGFSVPAKADKDYEIAVEQTVKAINQEDITESLSLLERLIHKYPNSKLSYLLMADLLAAKAGAFELINAYSDNSSQLNGLRDELAYRWRSVTKQNPAANGLAPKNLIVSAPVERYILAADASLSRLYVFENTGTSYRLVNDYYMTIGKAGMRKDKEGDLRTPEGVYHVTSYLPDEQLPPRYGPGAFPIDYPNVYDKKLQRTGYGIWIHGTEPENYNRVPMASDGCLSLSNDEFIDIQRYISTDGSTPVIISSAFEWIDPSARNSIKTPAQAAINQWKADWESLDTERYLQHYSALEFDNFEAFAERKRRINKSKRFISIQLSNLSIYSYPGDQNMMLVSFDQDYRSDNHHSVTQKTQYWRETQGKWQIIYEG